MKQQIDASRAGRRVLSIKHGLSIYTAADLLAFGLDWNATLTGAALAIGSTMWVSAAVQLAAQWVR